jgi:hypothetical protein
MSERPLNAVEAKTTDDVWIFVNVTVVIVGNEIAMECFPECQPDNECQGKAD